MALKVLIDKVVNHYQLTEEEAEQAMGLIMSGEATPAQIAALITALRLKGESVEEITGFAKAMRKRGKRITPHPAAIDTCGTGGDQSFTFNISTTVAFVVAAAGLPVAKHGNRSVSSRCGSADLLEELGVKVAIGPAEADDCLNETGIAFLYAPVFHEAMRFAVGPRREIGIRTIFNILGPLTNPVAAQYQLLGVYDSQLTGVMARVCRSLGVKRAMVVHGEDGLDEISHSSRTKVSELINGEIRTYYLEPEQFGIKRGSLPGILGGDARENARITRQVLGGGGGQCRDIVLLNSAAALLVGGQVDNLEEGMELAARTIDTGLALAKLEQLIEFTRLCA